MVSESYRYSTLTGPLSESGNANERILRSLRCRRERVWYWSAAATGWEIRAHYRSCFVRNYWSVFTAVAVRATTATKVTVPPHSFLSPDILINNLSLLCYCYCCSSVCGSIGEGYPHTAADAS